jgi:hypothetical protein
MLGGMDVYWLIHGTMPFDERVARLKRARLAVREKLARAQLIVEGLTADLAHIDGALADYLGKPDMLGGKQGGPRRE